MDIVVRSDAPTKSGGDSVQIAEYGPTFRSAGIDAREVPFHPAMRFRRGAVVHVFNVDRPFEFIAAARRARRHPLVVSPIHHDAAKVRAMRGADSGRGIVSVAGRLPEPVREWLATVVRSLRASKDPRSFIDTVGMAALALPQIPTVWRTAGAYLEDADAVALLARGEGTDLASLTRWSRRNEVLVPNGRPEDLDLARRRGWDERPVGSIVVVGRIEPRKRQLEIAQAADRLGVPITFYGPRFNEGDDYTRAFDGLAESSSSVTYGGAVGRAEVLRIMGTTRVLVNASWVEVQSLVDLEAAFMGCAVVASAAGHSKEWLGDSVTEIESGDPFDIVAAARDIASDGQRSVVEPSYDWTWARSAGVLIEVYRNAIG